MILVRSSAQLAELLSFNLSQDRDCRLYIIALKSQQFLTNHILNNITLFEFHCQINY